MGNGRLRVLLYTSTHLATPLHCYNMRMVTALQGIQNDVMNCLVYNLPKKITKLGYEVMCTYNVYVRGKSQHPKFVGGGVVMGR